MFLMQALVRTVAQNAVEEKNRETGAITLVWPIQLEHEGRNGKLEFRTVKAKSQAQADGWRKYIGKEIVTPINFVAVKTDCVPWLTEGQLPKAVAPQAVAAAA